MRVKQDAAHTAQIDGDDVAITAREDATVFNSPPRLNCGCWRPSSHSELPSLFMVYSPAPVRVWLSISTATKTLMSPAAAQNRVVIRPTRRIICAAGERQLSLHWLALHWRWYSVAWGPPVPKISASTCLPPSACRWSGRTSRSPRSTSANPSRGSSELTPSYRVRVVRTPAATSSALPSRHIPQWSLGRTPSQSPAPSLARL